VIQATGQAGRSITGTPAREPIAEGFVERGGVRVRWDAYGHGSPALLLLPPWSIVHSECWKTQIPYLSRHFRVITFDGRGNGLSDRPDGQAAYMDSEFVEDAAAVLDATGTETAFVVGLSGGGRQGLQLLARYPERVLGLVSIAGRLKFDDPPNPWGVEYSFSDQLDTDEGWARMNGHYWLRDWPGFVEFWFEQMFCEPHSTKQVEDAVTWGHDTDAETMLQTVGGVLESGETDTRELCDAVRATGRPLLVIHGTDDRLVPFEWGSKVAELAGGELVAFEGSGHGLHAREPVRVNLLIRDFVERTCGARRRPSTWRRVATRPRRALFVSSPIGLGHAWRDIAIADELRRQVPGLAVQWLAQEPVTTVLEARGETIHPASSELVPESDHVDREAGDHDLHCFQTLRRMDEILCANFMVFHDLVRDEQFDVWVGDEAWEIDHFLHENPELKTAPYVWLTDFVGYLPMPDGGHHEAFLTADYNAEMIGHVERLPRVRDHAIYVGEWADIVPHTFGPGLPGIRDWTERHYRMSGYIPGFDPGALPSREALRAELGYEPGERICLVSVGGSGVGEPLLRRVLDALPLARSRVPGLRMVAVTGPRIDPASLPAADGLEIHGYVHELYRHLAACDVAVVQQGLTTTMELVACGRPFLSLPLAHHFEQRFHVRHRLDRHGARDWMDWEDATPEAIAGAIERLLDSRPAYAPLPRDGAARAAGMIAELVERR
jgi:pimeloyl-ACP methyl ester carboxylesterase/predicted glycosyltransferase